jgi:hypothetical protein
MESTVVTTQFSAPPTRARLRSRCGTKRVPTSMPLARKIPACAARVSGAKPVQPDMPMVIFGMAWARQR